jgi:hypothetical protein
MTDLIARLEAATEGSRELDAYVARAVGINVTYSNEITPEPCGDDDCYLPNYTTSIDAALALIERKLPGSYIDLSGPRKYLHIPTPAPNHWRAEIRAQSFGWGATAPLALVLAILRALSAHDASTQGDAVGQISPTQGPGTEGRG